MQRLNLDFDEKPTTWPLPGIVLLVAGIGLTAMLIQHHTTVSDDLMLADANVTRLKRDLERQRVFGVQSEDRRAGESASTRTKRSSEQWDTLFDGFEAAADDTVTLLSFEPGAIEISLRGEARDLAAMTDYTTRLSAHPVLADIRVTEHEIARDHPRRPLRFSVRAIWTEAPR